MWYLMELKMEKHIFGNDNLMIHLKVKSFEPVINMKSKM